MSSRSVSQATRRVEVFRSIDAAGPVWSEMVATGNVFCSRNISVFWRPILPRGMAFRYALVREGEKPIAAVYTQILYFNGGESIRYHRQGPPARCFFQTFGQHIKGLVARQVGFSTLICGNLLLSGAHGYALPSPRADEQVLIEGALQAIRQELDREGIPVSVTLVKDFEPGCGPSPVSMRRMRYHDFQITPSLIMPLDPEWRTFGDYLGALSSKYRVRAKKARQLLDKHLTRRTMEADEVLARASELYQLYLRVVDDSGFNIITLHPGYFPALKDAIGEKAHIQGYFRDGELIGFLSAVRNGNGELEAHFLGYLEDWNPVCKLYLNMLLDLVDLGIRQGCRRVIFARTADEIKSSVGARPVDLTCYIRHRSPFSNKFIGPLLDYLSPREEPVLRHPFRNADPNHATEPEQTEAMA
jgi:hypothetical protein